jgi:two-component sensor histidine kinase
LRNARTPDGARVAIDGRLQALARAHDVLTRENWERAELRQLTAHALAPYNEIGRGRLHVSGPAVDLPPRMALALAMAFQELATNAVKYGALSVPAGSISISWSVERQGPSGNLRLRWEEKGGPPVQPPKRRGFGTRLIERSLAQDLDGSVRILFAPTGLQCAVEALLPESPGR